MSKIWDAIVAEDKRSHFGFTEEQIEKMTEGFPENFTERYEPANETLELTRNGMNIYLHGSDDGGRIEVRTNNGTNEKPNVNAISLFTVKDKETGEIKIGMIEAFCPIENGIGGAYIVKYNRSSHKIEIKHYTQEMYQKVTKKLSSYQVHQIKVLNAFWELEEQPEAITIEADEEEAMRLFNDIVLGGQSGCRGYIEANTNKNTK